MKAFTMSEGGNGRWGPDMFAYEPGKDENVMAGRPVVLIVDDVEDNLLALGGMLRRDDIEIVTASSGRAALEILLARDVALAVLDVNMPEMDGFTLAELMRGVKKTRYVPVIFVTAEAGEVSRVLKGYESGAVDFLVKPVDERILRSKVDVFVMLYEQRRQLVQADQMRELFIAILGHDLRNPLSALSMSTQLALRRSKDDDVKEPLTRTLRHAERMRRLVEQLLDVTKIHHGGVSLSPGPADLRAVLDQVVDEFAEHRQRISIEVFGDTVGTWDVDRLAQVVSNLVGNAIDHGLPGTPVSVRVNGTQNEALVLEVHNSGAAIPIELRAVLFEPFQGRKRARGLGLGLYVCKQFVMAHGGAIDFESSDENGTGFSVRLPRHSQRTQGE
jgi:signal transduction histidine kinase